MSEQSHVIPIFVDSCICSVLIAPVTVLQCFKKISFTSVPFKLNADWTTFERWLNVKGCQTYKLTSTSTAVNASRQKRMKMSVFTHVMFTSSHHSWSELELINTRLLQSHVTQKSLLIGPFRTKTDVRGPSWIFVWCERRIRDSLLILV